MAKPVIEFQNFGRSTHIIICGMDLSKGIYGASFDQLKDMDGPKLTLSVDVRELLRTISEITPEQMEQARKVIRPYLAGDERAVPDDGSGSMEVLSRLLIDGVPISHSENRD